MCLYDENEDGDEEEFQEHRKIVSVDWVNRKGYQVVTNLIGSEDDPDLNEGYLTNGSLPPLIKAGKSQARTLAFACSSRRRPQRRRTASGPCRSGSAAAARPPPQLPPPTTTTMKSCSLRAPPPPTPSTSPEGTGRGAATDIRRVGQHSHYAPPPLSRTPTCGWRGRRRGDRVDRIR